MVAVVWRASWPPERFLESSRLKDTITTIDSESCDSIGGHKHSLDQDTGWTSTEAKRRLEDKIKTALNKRMRRLYRIVDTKKNLLELSNYIVI